MYVSGLHNTLFSIYCTTQGMDTREWGKCSICMCGMRKYRVIESYTGNTMFVAFCPLTNTEREAVSNSGH